MGLELGPRLMLDERGPAPGITRAIFLNRWLPQTVGYRCIIVVGQWSVERNDGVVIVWCLVVHSQILLFS